MKITECLQNAANSVEAGAKNVCKQVKEFVGKEFTKMDPVTGATACDGSKATSNLVGVIAFNLFMGIGLGVTAIGLGIGAVFCPVLVVPAIVFGATSATSLFVAGFVGVLLFATCICERRQASLYDQI